jgi:hypothetical protein
LIVLTSGGAGRAAQRLPRHLGERHLDRLLAVGDAHLLRGELGLDLGLGELAVALRLEVLEEYCFAVRSSRSGASTLRNALALRKRPAR